VAVGGADELKSSLSGSLKSAIHFLSRPGEARSAPSSSAGNEAYLQVHFISLSPPLPTHTLPLPQSPSKLTSQEISSQVDRLSSELTKIAASSNKTIVVSNSSPISSSWILPLCVLGAGGAAYLYLKGATLSDLLPATRSLLDRTKTALVAAIADVSDRLAEAKTEIFERFGVLETKLAENHTAVSAQIDARVGDVQTDLRGMSSDISSVRSAVDDINARINSFDDRLAFTSRGVHLLCATVSENAGTGASRSLQELRRFAQTPPELPAPSPRASNPLAALSGWSTRSLSGRLSLESPVQRLSTTSA
jgi:hypothetical protein